MRFVKLDNKGLNYTNNDLTVVPSAKTPVDFVSVDWQIDNWNYDETYKLWQRKYIEKYKREVRSDLNGDGKNEFIKKYNKDLELVHAVTEAKMQIDVTVLPRRNSSTAIDVFLGNFVETISGGFSWYAKKRYSGSKAKSRVFSVKLIDTQEFKIGDNDAIIASVELADPAQLKLDPNQRTGVITLLLVRVNKFVFRSEDAFKTGKNLYPAILTVMLYARPKYHDEMLPDFYTLIDSIKLDGEKLVVPKLETAKPETPDGIQ
ncbi:MAG: hypothetical protein GY762_01960 [Proteobacteria bacterium]|nr:hypothetical protein [Pseudomonadota bacterium]